MATAPPPYSSTNPAMYPQAPPPPQPAPIVQTVVVAAPVLVYGDYPIQCTCPRCGSQIVTRVERKSGLLAWLICGILFLFGLWICCFIPFCVDSCKDTEHYCPHCNSMLGASKKL